MDKLPFYIVTSNATSFILPVTCCLYNKYWGSDQHYKILGNHPPTEKLPDNFEFIKIKDSNDINKWTEYLYRYVLQHEQSEYFVFSLDDFLPNGPLKPEIFSQVVSYAQSHNRIGRAALGELDVESRESIQNFGSSSLIRLKPDSLYRISCQTSVWNREYFLKYFKHDWTPWELELKGSKMAKHDGWELIGVEGELPFDWVKESALSGRWPGMVNILGLRPEDVKYFIDRKLFEPEKLQYGIWYECRIPFLSKFQSLSKRLTKIPKFSEIGYSFNWSMIIPYIRSRTFNRLYSHYKNIYPTA